MNPCLLKKNISRCKKLVVVLDNDECLGSWGIASGLYNLFVTYISVNTGINMMDCVDVFKFNLIKYYLNNGGARPGTKDTLKLIKYYKDIGVIDKVVMFTSASNNHDWVTFLKNCLEEFADVNGLYDIVLHNGNSFQKNAVDGATIKSLDVVLSKLSSNEYLYTKDNTKFLFFDDKPCNIQGEAKIIDVFPYRHIVNEKFLIVLLSDTLNSLEKLYIIPSDEQKRTGLKTFSPLKFLNIITDLVLVNKDGIKEDIYNNENVYKCAINQLDDNNLIFKGSKAFIEHVPLIKLSRCKSDDKYILPVLLKKTNSL